MLHWKFGVSFVLKFRENIAMQEYDLYVNAKKPAEGFYQRKGLYVRKGAGLPNNLADKADWVFNGTVAQDLLPPNVVEDLEAGGVAFWNMD